eukprot:Hpha_TRINITY_DN15859_c0_g1::TRINITY_DN15859_c0_g1_i1::g.189092::m.189092
MSSPLEGEDGVAAIINQARYITLATVSPDGEPWSAPLAFWTDLGKEGGVDFYCVSSPESRHVLHVKANPKVGVSICDTSVPFGAGKGIQFMGHAEVLVTPQDDDASWHAAMQGIAKRFGGDEGIVGGHVGMLKGIGYMVFRITPKEGKAFLSAWSDQKGDYRTPSTICADKIQLCPFPAATPPSIPI